MSPLVVAVLALTVGGDPGGRVQRDAKASGPPRFENELAGIKVGSTVAALQKRFPTLYRHRLPMGEILYEACDQQHLIVFNFAAEPWSPEFITHIDVRREDDVTVCRDATGALPDLGITTRTPRGIKIGDVSRRYVGCAERCVPTPFSAAGEEVTYLAGQRDETAALAGVTCCAGSSLGSSGRVNG